MCPLFDDSALGEDNDQVCMLDCAEAVAIAKTVLFVMRLSGLPGQGVR